MNVNKSDLSLNVRIEASPVLACPECKNHALKLAAKEDASIPKTRRVISKVTIKRFKRIESLTLDLGKSCLLIGANNSGKSSILQALHFAVSAAQTARLHGNVNWKKDKDNPTGPEIFQCVLNPNDFIYSPIANLHCLPHNDTLKEDKAKQIFIEIEDSLGERVSVEVYRGRNKNIGVTVRGKTLGEELMDTLEPFSIYAPGLSGIAREEKFLTLATIKKTVARGDANLVLRNIFHLLKSKNEPKWLEFKQEMTNLFGTIDFDVEFDGDKDEYIDVNFNRGNPGEKLPIEAAGTSILQASQILAYVILFKPAVLILDEPDAHLSPDKQRRLLQIISVLSSKYSFKVLISTHSPHLLDEATGQFPIFWISDGEKVKFEASDEDLHKLLELGALDSFEYLKRKNLKLIYLTEDSSMESLKFHQSLIQASGIDLKNVEIHSYHGCGNLATLKPLCSFAFKNNEEVRIIIHRDRDTIYAEEVPQIVESLAELCSSIFITETTDVEGIFLNAKHLSKLNSKPEAEMEELLALARSNTKKSSIDWAIDERPKSRSMLNGKEAASTVSARAYQNYDSDPINYSRGKIVLGELKNLFHVKYKSRLIFLGPTEHISIPLLAEHAVVKV